VERGLFVLGDVGMEVRGAHPRSLTHTHSTRTYIKKAVPNELLDNFVFTTHIKQIQAIKKPPRVEHMAVAVVERQG
jgi:hypothetical protein